MVLSGDSSLFLSPGKNVVRCLCIHILFITFIAGWCKIRPGLSYKKRGTAKPCLFFVLEESTDLASIDIDINSSIGRVRACSRHQADRPGHRTEELGSTKYENIPNRQYPTFGHSFFSRIMGKAQMGFDHHSHKILIFGVGLKSFCLGFCIGSPGDTVSAINFLSNQFNPLSDRKSVV